MAFAMVARWDAVTAVLRVESKDETRVVLKVALLAVEKAVRRAV